MNLIFNFFKRTNAVDRQQTPCQVVKKGIFTYRDGLQEDYCSNYSEVMGHESDKVGYGYEFKLHLSISPEQYARFKKDIISMLTTESSLMFKYTNEAVIRDKLQTKRTEELSRLYEGAQFTIYLPLLHIEQEYNQQTLKNVLNICLKIEALLRDCPSGDFSPAESQLTEHISIRKDHDFVKKRSDYDLSIQYVSPVPKTSEDRERIQVVKEKQKTSAYYLWLKKELDDRLSPPERHSSLEV